MAVTTNTPSRRIALRLGAAAAVAGITSPALASVAAPGADDELIALCDRMVQVQAMDRELYSLSEDPDSDPVIGPRLDAISKQWSRIMDDLADKEPTTLEGARAMARAAVANMARCADGSIAIPDAPTQLAFDVVQWLAGSVAA
jgi:hypothetical protein